MQNVPHWLIDQAASRAYMAPQKRAATKVFHKHVNVPHVSSFLHWSSSSPLTVAMIPCSSSFRIQRDCQYSVSVLKDKRHQCWHGACPHLTASKSKQAAAHPQGEHCGGRYLGGTTVCWLGLCIAEAILAMSLLHATPAEHVYPARIASCSCSKDVSCTHEHTKENGSPRAEDTCFLLGLHSGTLYCIWLSTTACKARRKGRQKQVVILIIVSNVLVSCVVTAKHAQLQVGGPKHF